MELTVTGHHVQVSERFRRLCAEKLTKVEQYARRTQRVEVVVSEETGRGVPKGSERVEITCLAKGPVIRAEAHAEDKYSALDLALAKLTERLRRRHERHTVSRRRGTTSIERATAGLPLAGSGEAAPSVEDDGTAPSDIDVRLGAQGDSPVHVREKVHSSPPMTLDVALSNMELVGHDFYLFVDADSGRPSVVYRRRGWDYGVLHLDVVPGEALDPDADLEPEARAG